MDSQTDFIARACPNCAEDNAELERQATEPADELPLQRLKDYWFGFFKTAMFFNYFRCKNCGFLFNRKFFTGPRLAQLYSAMPDNTAGENLRNLTKTQAAYFAFLKSCAPTEGTYLEMGPDIGLLAEVAALRGSYSQFILVEPNTQVHDRLKVSVGSKPSQILTDIFNLSQIPDSSVDTAVAIHVFDHMLDPRLTTNELYSKLKPGGHLLVVTHDEQSLLARTLGSKWPGHCLQHPHLFNRNTTREFFQKSGFEIVQTGKSVNYFSLDYLMTHLFWALGLGRLKPPRWLGLTLPLRLGNIISVVKKPKGA